LGEGVSGGAYRQQGSNSCRSSSRTDSVSGGCCCIVHISPLIFIVIFRHKMAFAIDKRQPSAKGSPQNPLLIMNDEV
jgi:hypothetical protein